MKAIIFFAPSMRLHSTGLLYNQQFGISLRRLLCSRQKSELSVAADYIRCPASATYMRQKSAHPSEHLPILTFWASWKDARSLFWRGTDADIASCPAN